MQRMMELPNSCKWQHPISSSWLEKCSSVLLFQDSEFSSQQSHPWPHAYTLQLHLFFSACWRRYNDMLTQLDRQQIKTITWKDGKDLLVRVAALSTAQSRFYPKSPSSYRSDWSVRHCKSSIMLVIEHRCPLMILLQFARSLFMYKLVVDTKKAASPWATHSLSLSILHLLANFVT